MDSLDAEFRKRFVKALLDLEDEQTTAFSEGAWAHSKPDAASVGAETLRRIGYLKALRDVKEMVEDVEAQLKI